MDGDKSWHMTKVFQGFSFSNEGGFSEPSIHAVVGVQADQSRCLVNVLVGLP